ncbi:MAG: hypothetical protein ACRYFU_22180 [Janthinobacterium lividum]
MANRSTSVRRTFGAGGRYDEAVDYRTEIALASAYPQHFLFIADDNHVFNALTANRTALSPISTSFAQRAQSDSFTSAVRRSQRYRWIEE